MKRSRGITLLVLFLTSFAAYLLWSAHPFFMGPELKFQVNVPPEVKRAIEEWYATRELGEPDSFSARAFIHMLAHPYDADVAHYMVTHESPISFKIDRPHYGARYFMLKDGKWSISLVTDVY